jgi:hypothetical protein
LISGNLPKFPQHFEKPNYCGNGWS